MGRCCFFSYVDDADVLHFKAFEPGQLGPCHVIVARDLDSEESDDYMLYGERWMNEAIGGGTIPRWSIILQVAYHGAGELEQLQERIAAEKSLTPDDVVALYYPRMFDDRLDDALAVSDQEERG
jgi:hypothetical protein